MRSDFEKYSVAHGLKMHEFMSLPIRLKKRLVRLMARISEKSFRRGFQHGKECKAPVVMPPADFRFDTPLDKSPSIHGYPGYSSIERLFMEFSVLQHIGFHESELEGRRPNAS